MAHLNTFIMINNKMTNMIDCQLWMGSLEPYMTESFILSAFRRMGENPLNVKIMRNKLTGEPAGYCFVLFANDAEAIDVMHKLNGKPIPSTNPVVRFKLNNASNNGRSVPEREFSIWVGDLSPDVDDYNLYRVFSSKYSTIRTAKVILDNSGYSKGYGFVRFGSEDEMKNSLIYMNGFVGLGTRALKICNAVTKSKGAPTNTYTSTYSTNTDYTQYYDPSTYWQNYANWQTQGYYDQSVNTASTTETTVASNVTPQIPEKKDDDLELIDHTIVIDVEKWNRDKMEQDSNLWDALEGSKWMSTEQIEVN
ncbi:tRNA selenocysteine 1-associated protein 1-like [Coccinella septempunctata]|uniref:tRNA selenocysteine 1-associated protein 1-like n=1 Tax=Coccinella septempunctata TaxID=41139 RepID=UPI001D081A57|nr:tRNA selenocysteine 1-associated protein 1-like [Coccinella septempunctata]